MYKLEKAEKEAFLYSSLSDLTKHHYQNCPDYAKIIESFDVSPSKDLASLPYLSCNIFKYAKLSSINEQDISKEMESSGTSGSKSKIYIGRADVIRQSFILKKIASEFFGQHFDVGIFLPNDGYKNGGEKFSANVAAVRGYSNLVKKKYYLNIHSEAFLDELDDLLVQHQDESILLFGFTFLIYLELIDKAHSKGKIYNHKNLTLLHGGGWKKLENKAIPKDEFRACFNRVFPSGDCHDYYGTVEQTGTVFFECEDGYFHCPDYAHVITRSHNGEECAPNTEGMIQLISTVPETYPGHSLLTEDMGRVIGDDDCNCGRKGRYFELSGRLPKTEVRGCSDAY